MVNIDQLAEQHIREHESRLRHMDELMERARKSGEWQKVSSEIEELRQERDKLAKHIDEIKKKSKEEWQVEGIEQSGPMIIWDAVAKKLEQLVQRIEQSKR